MTGVCPDACENEKSMLHGPSVRDVRVLDRTELAPGVILLGLYAPELAAVTRPGQFVMAIPPAGERAATALAVYEAQGERASLLFFVCGSRTRELAELRPGDILSLTGPLGNGFSIDGARDAAIVAGGVGIASVLLLAQRLIESGARVRLFYGARSSQFLVDRERFASAGCELCCATDDGSFGTRGFITELLAAAHDKPDVIFACGPSPMLRATAFVASELGVRAQLALEESFACGVGGCWGCVVPLSRESAQAPKFPKSAGDVVYARVCKEGPVFWAHELRW